MGLGVKTLPLPQELAIEGSKSTPATRVHNCHRPVLLAQKKTETRPGLRDPSPKAFQVARRRVLIRLRQAVEAGHPRHVPRPSDVEKDVCAPARLQQWSDAQGVIKSSSDCLIPPRGSSHVQSYEEVRLEP